MDSYRNSCDVFLQFRNVEIESFCGEQWMELSIYLLATSSASSDLGEFVVGKFNTRKHHLMP